jgi:hypothetical protein
MVRAPRAVAIRSATETLPGPLTRTTLRRHPRYGNRHHLVKTAHFSFHRSPRAAIGARSLRRKEMSLSTKWGNELQRRLVSVYQNPYSAIMWQ